MGDKPIIFSAAMVLALLAGRKTQTRRILKPRKGLTIRDLIDHGERTPPPRGCVASYQCSREQVAEPAFAPGDRLWVREAWGHDGPDLDAVRRGVESDGPSYGPYYAADANWFDNATVKRRSPIHMPRWASRLTLHVTEVRVQRLQEISEADAVAEGIEPLFTPAEAASRSELNRDPMPWLNYLWHGHAGVTGRQIDAWPHQFSSYADARGSFSSLWERIHGPGAWAENPWVAAVSFSVERANIHQARAAA